MAWHQAFEIAHKFWQTEDQSSCWSGSCKNPSPSESVCSSPSSMAEHWLASEERRLENLVVKYDYDWESIAEHFPKKSPEQLRKRWVNKIDPSIKKEEWSASEDQILKSLVRTHGENWNAIALYINGRPVPAIRKRYYELKEEWPKERDDFMEVDSPPCESLPEEYRMQKLCKRLEFLQGLIESTQSQIQYLHEEMYQEEFTN